MSCLFGSVVIGPPGSGKTTFCEAMSQFMKTIGREVAIVNLDPANENIPYPPGNFATFHDTSTKLTCNFCSSRYRRCRLGAA